jgi:hypothetical protein
MRTDQSRRALWAGVVTAIAAMGCGGSGGGSEGGGGSGTSGGEAPIACSVPNSPAMEDYVAGARLVRAGDASGMAAIERSCEAGNACGCSTAGLVLATGELVARDIERGVTLLERGCQGADAWGCAWLGAALFDKPCGSRRACRGALRDRVRRRHRRRVRRPRAPPHERHRRHVGPGGRGASLRRGLPGRQHVRLLLPGSGGAARPRHGGRRDARARAPLVRVRAGATAACVHSPRGDRHRAPRHAPAHGVRRRRSHCVRDPRATSGRRRNGGERARAPGGGRGGA